MNRNPELGGARPAEKVGEFPPRSKRNPDPATVRALGRLALRRR